MSYSQEKNPLLRKVSPLNANNPFKRISPLDMSERGVKHKDMSKDDKKKHKKAKHSKGGDPDMERERREEVSTSKKEMKKHVSLFLPNHLITEEPWKSFAEGSSWKGLIRSKAGITLYLDSEEVMPLVSSLALKYSKQG